MSEGLLPNNPSETYKAWVRKMEARIGELEDAIRQHREDIKRDGMVYGGTDTRLWSLLPDEEGGDE